MDAARGVAVISMFVAHTAPSNGPADVLYLSEFLTFPLFALLVGVGAELGARRLAVLPHGVASLVRAAALLGLGWWLAEAGAFIVIVLAPLGVLTLLCWGVSRLPTGAVAAVGLAAGLVAPWTIEASRDRWTELVISGSDARLWAFDLLFSTSYPQAVLLLLGCLGIVATRVLLPRGGEEVSWVLPAAITGVAVVVVLALSAARVLGIVDLMAYETTWLEESYVAALAIGVFAACLLVARLPVVRVLRPLAWVGAMTLTLYALQIGWLAWWARGLYPGTPDDAWVNVIGMSVGALVLASAWQLLRLSGPWGRGPLEGLVGTAVTLSLRALPGPDATAPVAPPAQVSSGRT